MNIYEKLLQEARADIASGEQGYICHAVMAAGISSDNMNAARKIRLHISTAISPYYSLTSWVRHNVQGFEDLYESNFGASERLMREYRLRWVDEALIPLVRTWEEPAAPAHNTQHTNQEVTDHE